MCGSEVKVEEEAPEGKGHIGALKQHTEARHDAVLIGLGGALKGRRPMNGDRRTEAPIRLATVRALGRRRRRHLSAAGCCSALP